MRYHLFVLTTFLFLQISHSVAEKLFEGDYVSGTIQNLYNQNINVTLPEGDWKVTRSDKDGHYQDIELYSDKYDSWAYIYTPLSPTTGDYWSGGGLEKCKGKDVFLSLIDRANPEASLCLKDEVIDGNTWSVALINVRSTRVPLKWYTLSFYIPVDRIKTSISDNQFKNIGKKVFKAAKNGFNGGNSGDISLLAEFIASENTESYADIYDSNDYENNQNLVSADSRTSNKKDLFICQIALESWDDIKWTKDEDWQYMVNEAKFRGLTPKDCDKIWTDDSNAPMFKKDDLSVCQVAANDDWTGWSSDTAYVTEAKKRGFSIKDCDEIGYGDKNPLGLTTASTETLFANPDNNSMLGVSSFNQFCSALDLECDDSLEKDYKEYIYADRYKAWAVTLRGNKFNNPAWGWFIEANSLSEAREKAMEQCEEYKYANEVCTIILEGNQVVNNILRASIFGDSNQTIYANADSKTVCLRATTVDGMAWESSTGQFGDYVTEAWKRNLDLDSCRNFTDRLPKNYEAQKTITVDLNSDNIAPEIVIDSNIEVSNARYTISGEVVDNSKVYICIFDNCKIANNGKFQINRFNPAGETLNIIAKDEFGNTSSKSVVVSLTKKENQKQLLATLDPMKIKKINNRNRVALIIGIEDYKFSSKANYANRDALYFTEYLEQMGIRSDKIKTLKDSEAGLIDIYSAIEKWLPAQIIPGKTEVFLYFAGHGLAANNGKDLFLLAHDTDTDMLNRSSIARSELFELINSAQPKHTFVFLDTCYSGAGRQGEMLMASARGLVVVDDEQSTIPENFTIFSAAQGNQIASGLDQVQHGLFSYFTMKGLEGEADYNNDKEITTMELAQYVENNVRQEAVNIGREQVPMMHGNKDITITNIN